MAERNTGDHLCLHCRDATFGEGITRPHQPRARVMAAPEHTRAGRYLPLVGAVVDTLDRADQQVTRPERVNRPHAYPPCSAGR